VVQGAARNLLLRKGGLTLLLKKLLVRTSEVIDVEFPIHRILGLREMELAGISLGHEVLLLLDDNYKTERGAEIKAQGLQPKLVIALFQLGKPLPSSAALVDSYQFLGITWVKPVGSESFVEAGVFASDVTDIPKTLET